MPCNWGVLGAGFIANRAVIPALQGSRNARVVAVASRDETRATSTAAQHAIPRIYHDYEALLDDPDVRVVYIALPNSLHREWAIRAAQHGKHVLCEKPFAMNAAECDEMIDACHNARVLLMEAVMYRFHPRMQALKAMLDAGAIGEIRLLHAAFSFPFDAPTNYRAFPEFGGGALLDIGSYCLNAARWFIGREPVSAGSEISYSHNAIDVTASAILKFETFGTRAEHLKQMAHIQCSFEAAEHQVIEVIGSEAAVTAPLAFTAWREDETQLLIQRGGAFEQRVFQPTDPYRLMVEHFSDCVLGRATLLFPPEDGRATMRVLDMLREQR